jgi:sigma-B regulation protein RsbU (phosphoserine phosphatase)
VRVLVVDDDRVSRMIVSDLLVECGREVVCAEDGAVGWQHLQDDPSFSLVVTDWEMPNVDGPEFCRRIRRADRAPYLPVLLSTSLDQERHLADGLDAGADAFLSKLIGPSALAAQIRVAERILRLEEKLQARVRSLQEAHDCIERDLRAAAVVQMSHLPNSSPALPSVEFAWVYDSVPDPRRGHVQRVPARRETRRRVRIGRTKGLSGLSAKYPMVSRMRPGEDRQGSVRSEDARCLYEAL